MSLWKANAQFYFQIDEDTRPRLVWFQRRGKQSSASCCPLTKIKTFLLRFHLQSEWSTIRNSVVHNSEPRQKQSWPHHPTLRQVHQQLQTTTKVKIYPWCTLSFSVLLVWRSHEREMSVMMHVLDHWLWLKTTQKDPHHPTTLYL